MIYHLSIFVFKTVVMGLTQPLGLSPGGEAVDNLVLWSFAVGHVFAVFAIAAWRQAGCDITARRVAKTNGIRVTW